MRNADYFLLLKTGQAEMRGYKELHDDHKIDITPIVELTRGRKNHPATINRTGDEYNFETVKNFIKDNCGKSRSFFIDITRTEKISSIFTKSLQEHRDGYQNWINFFLDIQQETPNAFPILQIDPDSAENQSVDEYKNHLFSQFDKLSSLTKKIGYRAFPKEDAGFDYDLHILKSRIEKYVENGGIFYLILDYDYIRPGTGELYSLEVVKVLDAVHDIINCVTPILISTSFPNSVTDVGNISHGEFSEEEVILHRAVSRLSHNKFNVLYGDYGSINPIRNDDIIAANGWKPRIDYPFSGEKVFYFREGRKYKGTGRDKVYTTTYSQHYASVAVSVSKDSRFLLDPIASDLRSWGVAQIIRAAQRNVPSSSPSFWISVRFNIHIQQQLRRLSIHN